MKRAKTIYKWSSDAKRLRAVRRMRALNRDTVVICNGRKIKRHPKSKPIPRGWQRGLKPAKRRAT